MDVKDYIESGIVELYAMDALSPDDKKEFERMAKQHPEVKAELNKVEQTLEDYSFSYALNPRPQLRTKIMDEVTKTKPSSQDKSKVKQANKEIDFITYKYLIAASLAALVISTFASWFFYSRWVEAEERYTNLLNDKNELAQNYNLIKLTFDETLSDFLIMRDENAKIFELNSTDTANYYKARIYWNTINHHSYIDVLSLPIPEEGKQFQLWAMTAGKPIDAGVFMNGDQGLQRMKDIENVDMWTVTLEPKGGSVTPTLNQIYLISKNR